MVRLLKTDGKEIAVAKEKLNTDAQNYVEDAFKKLDQHRSKLSDWQSEKSQLEDLLVSANLKASFSEMPKPKEPSRQQLLDDIAAAERMELETKEKQLAQARQKKEKQERLEEEEAARKAEVELDVNGLVLLRKTVEGSTGKFGGKITGIVENRRKRKLSYAQISFNLYDSSGAQIGSAIANINGLEPGGKWKFEATTFGTDFDKYKFSELSGF